MSSNDQKLGDVRAESILAATRRFKVEGLASSRLIDEIRGNDLVATIRDLAAELVAKFPNRALDMLGAVEGAIASAEAPHVGIAAVGDECRVWHNGSTYPLSQLLVIDTSQRWTAPTSADVDARMLSVNYDGFAEYHGLAYALDVGEPGRITIVRLPEGWEEL